MAAIEYNVPKEGSKLSTERKEVRDKIKSWFKRQKEQFTFQMSDTPLEGYNYDSRIHKYIETAEQAAKRFYIKNKEAKMKKKKIQVTPSEWEGYSDEQKIRYLYVDSQMNGSIVNAVNVRNPYALNFDP